MKITCISASNVEPARGHSASTRTCELVREIIRAEGFPNAEVKILPLIDYEMTPCRMCGKCFTAGKCVRDEAFNSVHDEIKSSDALFVVCPHYAPLPSKVMMLLEKMQEIWYLNWCQDNNYSAPYSERPIGLIAHGGQTAEALPYYKRTLLDPLANAFASVQFKVISTGEQWPTGAVFGVKNLSLPIGSIFVAIDHDWDEIRERVTPLVRNVLGMFNR